MKQSLLDKKILILGGSSDSVETVRYANQMGMKTIVVDPVPGSPAKNFAWKSYNVDALDVEALVDICETEQVDGVLIGLSERLLEPYSKLCSRLGMPCYCTTDQVAIFSDKIAFKQKCREFGIPVVNDYTLDDHIPYPVLVKPAASSGSKGISVCYNEEELLVGIARAKSYSHTGKYLIEDYLKGEQITAIYTVLGGTPYLSLLNDRYVVKPYENLGSIGVAVVFPSKHAKLYVSTIHEKMCSMLKHLDFKNAPLSFQAFIDGDTIRLYDPALRIGGGRNYIITEKLSGFNIQEALLRFAVTGNMLDDNAAIPLREDDWKIKGKYSLQPNLIIKTGTIGNVEGMEQLASIPGMIFAFQMREEGEVISLAGTSQQTAIRLCFIADTLSELLVSYQKAIDSVKITDTQGRNMILPPFNFRDYFNDYDKVEI